MNDQIETAVEATSDMQVYSLTRSTAIAIGALTTYGGYALVRDSSAKVMKFLQNRKAKAETDLKVVETDPKQ
jgi:hypothetical protein